MRGLGLKEERILSCAGEVVLCKNGKPLFENAIECGEALRIEVRIPRALGGFSATLVIKEDASEKTTHIPMHARGLSGAADRYVARFCPREAGLFWYSVEVDSPHGHLFAVKREGRRIGFTTKVTEPSLQLTVSSFAYPAPAWIRGGVIYHIFVDRFRKKGEIPPRADARINPDWEGGIPEYPAYPGAFLRNNEFFGGNLDGITEKLPYLASLGVNCLYLSPIFEAASNHKYDTGDYRRVDDMFGGDGAFLRLLRAAKRRGIRVVLDGVFNHTGADSRYFNRYGRYETKGAYQSKSSPYYSWYRFQHFPDRYTAWWDIDILPRIHPEEPSCRDFFIGEDGVIAQYAALGIGGMRLDVADELDDDFIAGIKRRLAEASPDNILFGEVWEDASHKIAYGKRRHYYLGRELDGVMNYPLRRGLVDYFRDGNTDALRYALAEVLPNTPKRIADTTMNLLGTHDTVRILTALAGELPEGKSNDILAHAKMSEAEYKRGVRLLKNAYLTLATLPGIPTVYYGDEAGMQGYSDPMNRLPYPWGREDRELVAFYQAVGRLRRACPVYREGRFRLLTLTPELLLFVRYDAHTACLTAINQSTRALILRFGGSVTACLKGETRGKCFTLPAGEGMVYRSARGNRVETVFL